MKQAQLFLPVDDRRLHRLLRRHPSRHQHGPDAAARTIRCCRITSGCRSATTAAARRSWCRARRSCVRAARRSRPMPPRRSSGRAGDSITKPSSASSSGPGNRLGQEHSHQGCARPRVRRRAAQRLVGARHPGLGIPAARTVPRQELRHHDLAVDRDAGSARAVPLPRLRARGRRPEAAALPSGTTKTSARAVSRSKWRCTCRARRCRRRRGSRARASATRTGPWRSSSRTTPRTAATCARATCSAPARSRARRPDSFGSMMELTQGGKNPLALPSGETRTFLEDGDEVVQRGYCQKAARASVSARRRVRSGHDVPRRAGARRAGLRPASRLRLLPAVRAGAGPLPALSRAARLLLRSNGAVRSRSDPGPQAVGRILYGTRGAVRARRRSRRGAPGLAPAPAAGKGAGRAGRTSSSCSRTSRSRAR